LPDGAGLDVLKTLRLAGQCAAAAERRPQCGGDA
jgi:hypothetical protein